MNGSILDAPLSSIVGLAWISYSIGLAAGGLWFAGGTFTVLGLLFLLHGEGFRVTRRKDPEETAE